MTCRSCCRQRSSPTACRIPLTSTSPPTWPRRGPRRSRPAGRTGSTRVASGSAFPTRAPSRRCGRGQAWSLTSRPGRSGSRSRRRRWPKPPRRWGRRRAPRRWPAAAATAARSSTERARGCARTSAPPSTAWRPRPAAPGSPCSSSPASAPTPNRRRSSPPIPTRPGWRRRATRCTAARPSSISVPTPPTPGSPPTPAASASSRGTPGRHGITASTRARRPARRRATR